MVKGKGRGQVKGKMAPVSHLKLRTDAGTLQPEVVALEDPMVKGGGGARNLEAFLKCLYHLRQLEARP